MKMQKMGTERLSFITDLVGPESKGTELLTMTVANWEMHGSIALHLWNIGDGGLLLPHQSSNPGDVNCKT